MDEEKNQKEFVRGNSISSWSNADLKAGLKKWEKFTLVKKLIQGWQKLAIFVTSKTKLKKNVFKRKLPQ